MRVVAAWAARPPAEGEVVQSRAAEHGVVHAIAFGATVAAAVSGVIRR